MPRISLTSASASYAAARPLTRRSTPSSSAFLAVYLACFRRYDNVLAAGKEGTIVLAAKETTSKVVKFQLRPDPRAR
jgi:hypothetical protein